MIYLQKQNRMITRLQEMGISDTQVLNAMRRVPRHKFVRQGLEHQAYDEKALPIGFDQTISHPYTVAVMTQALDIRKNDKVLEIGTGSGYQAAVLCEMGAQVFTVEKIPELGQAADRLLRELGYHYALRIGDGTLGWQNYAPYTAIIVTAGAPVIPENLITQLKPEGKLLIPVGNQDEQILTLYLKMESGYRKFELEKLSFVPLVGKQGWK
jgi:protein-L-isoaspartate(D-aspartate) O-methyltransferase